MYTRPHLANSEEMKSKYNSPAQKKMLGSMKFEF